MSEQSYTLKDIYNKTSKSELLHLIYLADRVLCNMRLNELDQQLSGKAREDVDKFNSALAKNGIDMDVAFNELFQFKKYQYYDCDNDKCDCYSTAKNERCAYCKKGKFSVPIIYSELVKDLEGK